MRGFRIPALMLLAMIGGCQLVDTDCDDECLADWVDGGNHPDPCLDSASRCLVSQRIPAPTAFEKESLGVVIAIHGFSATSAEWQEFADFVPDTSAEFPRTRISRVVLGGHGIDLDAFQGSSWQAWGKPIMAEYDSLIARGFRNVSFACASAGCALLMEYLANGAFDSLPSPRRVFMIDPVVVPTAKALSLINLVGPILGNSPNEGTPDENTRWYVNRPQETLAELYELINRVRNRLESGFRLPKGTRAWVRKSKRDRSADPVGALLIYKGMRESDGGHADVRLVDSRLHVFTRLSWRRGEPTDADRALQAATFREIAGMAAE